MLPADALAQTLGLGPGTGQHGRFNRALDRLAQFRLAEWIEPGRSIAVYTEVAPLRDHRLGRLPEWTREAHERLLDAHLDRIAAVKDYSAQVAEVTARLDRFERPTAPGPPPEQGPRTMTPRTPGTRPGSVPVPARSRRIEGQIRRAHICRFPSGKPASPSRSGRL